ncbi:sulfite exporter TauE/SafE family protein [Seohaeicola nanhaiensis]|uniref:Probable membrane transporter protein n=1 Tax=Seohaeicola nanhaiensis TaxID=1387282 RepID=A0ABV9KCE0_9RHOB
MTSLVPFLDPFHLVLALAIALLSGLVKGMVGFAMPMILVSGLGTFLPPEIALAGLILPTVVTNGMQALGQGLRAALGSVRQFRVFLIAGLVCLLISAQLVRLIAPSTFLLALGVPVTFFALIQLFGLRLRFDASHRRIEALFGAIAGFIGGLSGVWGPPTVMYLTALDTPKQEQLRIQGVIYGLGAVALLGAHFTSGVMRAETLPFSLILVLPAMLGMWIGGLFVHQIDQATFRKATLAVLLIAGLNLIRRGLL